MRVAQEFFPFQILIGNERDRFGTISLETSKVLSLVSREIGGVNRQQEPMAGVGITMVIASDVSI